MIVFNIKNIKKFIYLGKLVKDIKTSLGPSNFEASCLLYFILASTILKWTNKPPYGFPGVPSSI